MSYKYETLTKLNQHVNEMMATAGKKFQNFLWSRFLIIVQNVNMVVKRNCNSRLNPLTLSSWCSFNHFGRLLLHFRMFIVCICSK